MFLLTVTDRTTGVSDIQTCMSPLLQVWWMMYELKETECDRVVTERESDLATWTWASWVRKLGVSGVSGPIWPKVSATSTAARKLVTEKSRNVCCGSRPRRSSTARTTGQVPRSTNATAISPMAPLMSFTRYISASVPFCSCSATECNKNKQTSSVTHSSLLISPHKRKAKVDVAF